MNDYSLFSYFSFLCKNLNIPLILTLFRFLLIPFICTCIIIHSWDKALWLFLVAGLTDIFDGALARLTNSETVLGAYLDPLADKCLVLLSFWSLSISSSMGFTIPNWFMIFLLIKELLLIFAATYFGMLKNNITIKASIVGKGANFFQSVCLIMLFIAGSHGITVSHFLNLILFFIIMVNSIALFHYFWLGYKELTREY